MKSFDHETPINIMIGGLQENGVHIFKFLGTRSNLDALCDEEIKLRLIVVRNRMCQLNTSRRSRAVSDMTKGRLIQALWPILTYGAKVWRLNKLLRGTSRLLKGSATENQRKFHIWIITKEEVLETIDQENCTWSTELLQTEVLASHITPQ